MLAYWWAKTCSGPSGGGGGDPRVAVVSGGPKAASLGE